MCLWLCVGYLCVGFVYTVYVGLWGWVTVGGICWLCVRCCVFVGCVCSLVLCADSVRGVFVGLMCIGVRV